MPAGADAALAAVERLRRLLPDLADGNDDAQWLSAALGRYLEMAPAGGDLNAALGVAVPPGGTPWWQAEAAKARDDAIRELAGTIGGTMNAKAVALQQRLRRYAAASWPRDRVTKRPTAANAVPFRVYSADPNPPTGVRRLTEIIAS
jgi:hypothetical protein